ncbi:kinase-like protein [Rickenella mellea]|uniref:Kinase-like protein n=1 Tax=Rickenella mellea TaxID=50990 RepID=A0A4Y7PYR6_9AGAM|nr:kinase-like protein [Rickenella mellea]
MEFDSDHALFQFMETLSLDGGRVKGNVSDALVDRYNYIWKGNLEGRCVAIRARNIIDDTAAKTNQRRMLDLGTWATVDHKNILPLLGYCEDFIPTICFISPWTPNGTVVEFVKNHPETDLISLVKGIAQGMEYLHSISFVHGDLRCANILVSDEKKPLICDIGLANHAIKMSGPTYAHNSCRWRAPELYSPEKFGLTMDVAYSPRSDVWSFGMTILELLTTKRPYDEIKSKSAVVEAIISGRIPHKPVLLQTSSAASGGSFEPLEILWPLCLQCWVRYPTSRLSMLTTLQTLQKLSHKSSDNAFEHLMDNFSSKTQTFSDTVDTSFGARKVDRFYRAIITMSVVSYVLAWGILMGGGWPMGFLWPWLGGSVVWFILKFNPPKNVPWYRTVKEFALEGMKGWAWVTALQIGGFAWTAGHYINFPAFGYVAVFYPTLLCEMDFTTSPWPPEAQNLTGKVQIKPNYDAQKFPLAGGYADVWPGVWKVDGQTPRNVAIKAPRLPHILEITSEKLTTRQKRELGSWAAVEHKNILPFLGYCTDLNPYICLVSPWMSNGTAIDYVKTRPDVDRVQMIIGVAEGLDFLHSKNIVHGDVRGGNILISDNGEPLLADFGLSRHIHDMPASTKPKGTLRWEAPELQDPEEYGLDAQPAHALPIDVWSFGMTVLEIMTGTHPYSELNDGALIIAVRKRQIPQKPKSGVTALDKLWPICLQCWVFWPNSRPTMDETVRTLRRLTVDDAATTLQLHLDDAVNSAAACSSGYLCVAFGAPFKPI